MLPCKLKTTDMKTWKITIYGFGDCWTIVQRADEDALAIYFMELLKDVPEINRVLALSVGTPRAMRVQRTEKSISAIFINLPYANN